MRLAKQVGRNRGVKHFVAELVKSFGGTRHGTKVLTAC